MEKIENYKKRCLIFFRVDRSVTIVTGQTVCRLHVITENLSKRKEILRKA